jgi:hypothetical protein
MDFVEMYLKVIKDTIITNKNNPTKSCAIRENTKYQSALKLLVQLEATAKKTKKSGSSNCIN